MWKRNTHVVGLEARVRVGASWQMDVELTTWSLPISLSTGAQEAHSPPRFVFRVQCRFDGYITTTRLQLTFDEAGTEGSASSISSPSDRPGDESNHSTSDNDIINWLLVAPFTAKRIFKTVLPLSAVRHFHPRLAFGQGRPLDVDTWHLFSPFSTEDVRSPFVFAQLRCHQVAPFCGQWGCRRCTFHPTK